MPAEYSPIIREGKSGTYIYFDPKIEQIRYPEERIENREEVLESIRLGSPLKRHAIIKSSFRGNEYGILEDLVRRNFYSVLLEGGDRSYHLEGSTYLNPILKSLSEFNIPIIQTIEKERGIIWLYEYYLQKDGSKKSVVGIIPRKYPQFIMIPKIDRDADKYTEVYS